METKKINNIKVKAIPGVDRDGKKGNEFFDKPNANVYLLAKKQTGKSTVIYNILEKLVDKNTTVIIFAGMLDKDKSYEKIIELLLEKGILPIAETSLKDKEGNDQLGPVMNEIKNDNTGIASKLDSIFLNTLNDMVSKANDEDNKIYGGKGFSEKEEKIEKPRRRRDHGLEIERENKKEEKSNQKIENQEKKIPEKYIIVIDDLSDEIRTSKSLESLLKKNDHMNATVLISTQYKTDLPPGAIAQMDYVLAFAGIPDNPKTPSLNQLYSGLGLKISFDEFRKLYHNATKSDIPGEISRNFLYIDTKKNLFRKNFDSQYILP